MRCRDAITETYLSQMYGSWAQDMRSYEGDHWRRMFYEDLFLDIHVEQRALWGEANAASDGVRPFAKFEYNCLNQDGGTKKIEGWACSQWHDNVGRNEAVEEIMAKYGHLAPPEYVPDHPRGYNDFRKSLGVNPDGREVCW